MTAARPLRIAHFADTHLGYRALYRIDSETGRNQRSLDIEHAFEQAIDDILRREVDLVIHAGDVFHHTRPAYSALRAFVRGTRKLERAGKRTLVIGGNHDTPRLRTSASAFSVLDLALPEIAFVTAYDDAEVQFPDLELSVTAIPHGRLTAVDPPYAYPRAGVRNILVTHGTVPGMDYLKHKEPGEEEISDTLMSEPFDYIALGHYHVFGRQRHNAWYSGSTERMGWGDREVDPGYAIVTLGALGEPAQVEHIPIEARPMKLLPTLSGEGKGVGEIVDIVLQRLERLQSPRAMTRVMLTDVSRSMRREAESLLRREAPAYVWSLEVTGPSDLLRDFGERRDADAPSDPLTLFGAFVEERVKPAHDEAFTAAFKTRGELALTEAMREVEQANAEDAVA